MSGKTPITCKTNKEVSTRGRGKFTKDGVSILAIDRSLNGAPGQYAATAYGCIATLFSSPRRTLVWRVRCSACKVGKSRTFQKMRTFRFNNDITSSPTAHDSHNQLGTRARLGLKRGSLRVGPKNKCGCVGEDLSIAQKHREKSGFGKTIGSKACTCIFP